jgi:NAD(P)-dependent dehydrogenase (short-subunit alcohol dehydrogenase family)
VLLENKNAVIYGGGGAIGGAVARAFAREGARVFLAGRTLATLEAVAEEIRSAGGVAETAEVDALDEKAVDEHADAVAASVGGIDISFNLISHEDIHGTPLAEMPLEDFERPVRNAVRTMFLTSRAAFLKLEAYKAKKGWIFPWYSSCGSDFNYNFHVTLDESVAPIVYNYRTKAEHEQVGTFYFVEGEQPIERHGHSCFLGDGNDVFHTYSMYGRGAETVGGSYYFLDLTALGRQEDWEEPKGRATEARGAIPDFSS